MARWHQVEKRRNMRAMEEILFLHIGLFFFLVIARGETKTRCAGKGGGKKVYTNEKCHLIDIESV